MLTKNHRLVLEVVQESGLGRHRSAHDIFADARHRHPRIGQTTIYRALARLRDLGLVREVMIPGGEWATYEPMGAPHAHFHCAGCGTIADLDYQLPADVTRSLALRNGVEIASETVTFEGYCAACRAPIPVPAQGGPA